MTVKSGVVGCVAFFAAMVTAQASADCTPAPVTGNLDYSVCKEWPAYPGLTISAKALFERRPTPGDVESNGMYAFDLSVLQDGQKEPLATYHQAAAFEQDGVAVYELTLDTARYKLTSDLRAFGVRVRLSNGSRLSPVDETQLSLYVRQGEKLRPVLRQLAVYEYGGEWDDVCAGDRYEISRTVEIAKTTSHGYADLIVKTQQTNTTSAGEGDACEDKITVGGPVLTTLRYDGNAYVLPAGFKAR